MTSEFLGLQGDQTSQSNRKSVLILEGLMLKLKLQNFGHLMWRTDSLEKTLMLQKIEAGGEGDDRGWDDMIASPTQWTWVWAGSRSWWWTGMAGVLQPMGLQRHDWGTELNYDKRPCCFLIRHVQLFTMPWTAACQAQLSFTISQSLLKFMSIESVVLSNHLIFCRPLSFCLQSFPASGSFQMSQFFASGGQSIGVSASTSVLPMNTQNWSPLGWTGWISLQSKGLSRVFSNATVQKHQFFSTQLSL